MRDRTRGASHAQLVGGVRQGTDLGQPGLGELTVVLACKGTDQGDALQAQQVRQRVLIDGGVGWSFGVEVTQ
jgi:hypothetical protein